MKHKPNGKLLAQSILEGPYKYRKILKLGYETLTSLVPYTYRLQTDIELNETERKQDEADDQAISILLLRLPTDVYDVVDSCQTTNEMWHPIQKLKRGIEIGIQEKSILLLDELERFTSIGSYIERFSILINDLDRNKLTHPKLQQTSSFSITFVRIKKVSIMIL
ncbi:hypothetical protein Tco_1062176 [Tanacetum coccineum]